MDAIVLSDILVRTGNSIFSMASACASRKEICGYLLGAGASGKTTVFKLLMGERKPERGEVIVGGVDVASLKGNALAKFRRSVGMIPQDGPLLEHRTVEEQILLPLEIDGMHSARRHAQAQAVIARFNLQSASSRMPASLSMSERQRTAIARAVVREPMVLLADEPAAHLDANDAKEIAGLLLHENLRGMTVLIATSDEHFASYFPETSVIFMEALAGIEN